MAKRKSLERNRRTKVYASGRRGQGGGLLVLSVCILVMFLLIVSPFYFFLANLSTQIVVTNDAEHIARQAAGVIDDYRLWLDSPRPGYDESKAFEVARTAAITMCEKEGLKLEGIGFGTTTDASGTYRTMCSVNVDARSRFPFLISAGMFDMRSYFSGKIQTTGFTEHTDQKAYSIVHMDAPNRTDESKRRPLGFNQRDVAVLPSYGNFYTAVAGETTNPTPYGAGLAPNLSPENFMSMNHYHFKKSDFDYVMKTGNDVTNNAWHVTRLIDGKWITIVR
jgi:hypothetical protein